MRRTNEFNATTSSNIYEVSILEIVHCTEWVFKIGKLGLPGSCALRLGQHSQKKSSIPDNSVDLNSYY